MLAAKAAGEPVDQLLSAGSFDVIDKIRIGHGILSRKTKKEWDLYSFATKYASWHRPDIYPIYDGLIGELLPKLNTELHFCDLELSRQQLKTYSNLVKAIETEALEAS